MTLVGVTRAGGVRGGWSVSGGFGESSRGFCGGVAAAVGVSGRVVVVVSAPDPRSVVAALKAALKSARRSECMCEISG